MNTSSKVEISPTEWERMREQRDLLFDKNAPSTIIQEKTRKETGHSVKSSQIVPEVSRKQEGGGITGGLLQTDTKSPEKKYSGGLFKRKKKNSVTDKESNSTTITTSPGKAVSKKDKEQTAAKKKGFGHKRAQSEEVKKQTGTKPSAPLSTGSRKKGEQWKGQAMKVTNIDDVEEEETVKEVSDAEMTECVRKTFSYEGQILPLDSNGQPSSNVRRSHSHNTPLKISPLPKAPEQNDRLQPPVVSHKRSRSYHGEEEEGGTNEGRTETKLNVESRTASKSQSNISKLKPEAKVEIDSNVRVKKSGVVKGASSRGTSQRPTLEVSTLTHK